MRTLRTGSRCPERPGKRVSTERTAISPQPRQVTIARRHLSSVVRMAAAALVEVLNRGYEGDRLLRFGILNDHRWCRSRPVQLMLCGMLWER